VSGIIYILSVDCARY